MLASPQLHYVIYGQPLVSKIWFADMHDVHYAPNASNMSFPVNATVHSNYNIMDRPLDAYTGTMTSQGPPGIQF